MPNRFDPPSDLPSNHAFGELVIRNERRTILYAVPAQVDLATGALHAIEPVSRSGYDWCSDEFSFRLSARGEAILVEEGCEIDPNLDFCVQIDLEPLQEAWRKKAVQHMDKVLPKSRGRSSRPRM